MQRRHFDDLTRAAIQNGEELNFKLHHWRPLLRSDDHAALHVLPEGVLDRVPQPNHLSFEPRGQSSICYARFGW